MALKVAWGMIAAALIIAIVSGFGHGSILGGVIALGALAPACYGAWQGMQKESQAPMALAMATIFIALIVAALLFILKVFGWFH